MLLTILPRLNSPHLYLEVTLEPLFPADNLYYGSSLFTSTKELLKFLGTNKKLQNPGIPASDMKGADNKFAIYWEVDIKGKSKTLAWSTPSLS